jgi:L-lactate dehydrogenase (cytochrome)
MAIWRDIMASRINKANALTLPHTAARYLEYCATAMSTADSQKWPRKLARCVNLDDMRELARNALPYPIFDHVDGGSDDEVTLQRNQQAFGDYALIPHYCSGVEEVDASTTVLGQRIEWPWFAGPAGGLKYLHRDGEIGVARAAQKFGTAYAMSGWTNTKPEDITAAAPEGPKFFQLQPCRSREVMADMIQLAKDTGYNALIVTVDNPIHGNRERDARSGFGVPANFTLKAWASILSKPRWAFGTLPMPGFGLYDKYMTSPDRDMNWLAHQLITNITFDDLAWMREQWDGPFAVKGLMAVQDMREAVECGVSAVILSNQGARHFDTAPSTLDMLPAVVDAVGNEVEVILDSGVRRGTDVLKAIALGATACTGARPYCYGLAGAGQRGVERAMDLLRAEVERTMVFLGTARLGDVTRDHVMRMDRHDQYSKATPVQDQTPDIQLAAARHQLAAKD